MNSDVTTIATWDDSNEPEWIKRINWDEYEKLAGIGYSPDKIAMYYNIKKIEFMYYYMLLESKLEYHYSRGVLFYQAKAGMAMVDDADTNSTQAQRLDKLQKTVKFQNARDQILYGGI